MQHIPSQVLKKDIGLNQNSFGLTYISFPKDEYLLYVQKNFKCCIRKEKSLNCL